MKTPCFAVFSRSTEIKIFTPKLLGGLIAFGLSASGTAAQLGNMRVNSALGEVFSAQIPVRLSPGETLGAGCVGIAQPQNTDPNAAALQDLSVRLVDGVGANRILTIRSDTRVSEPAIRLAVKIGCDSSITREFTALLDPPSVSVNQWTQREQAVEEPVRFKLVRSRNDSVAEGMEAVKSGRSAKTRTADDGASAIATVQHKPKSSAKSSAKENVVSVSDTVQNKTYRREIKQMQLSGEIATESLQRVGNAEQNGVARTNANLLLTDTELREKVEQAEAEAARQAQLAAVQAGELSNQKARLMDLEDNTVPKSLLLMSALGALLGGLVIGGGLLALISRSRRTEKTPKKQASLIKAKPLMEKNSALMGGVRSAEKTPAAAITAEDRNRHEEKPISFADLLRDTDTPTVPQAVPESNEALAWPEVTDTDDKVAFWSAEPSKNAARAVEVEEVNAERVLADPDKNPYQSSADDSSRIDFEPFTIAGSKSSSGVDAPLQAALNWLQTRAAQAAAEHGDNERAQWLRHVEPTAWLPILFDKKAGKALVDNAVERLKANLAADSSAPLSVWSLWMCWLHTSNNENMFHPMAARFRQRFGKDFPVRGNALIDHDETPDVLQDVIDRALDSCDTLADKKRLLLSWLDDKDIPAHLMVQPHFYLNLFRRVTEIEATVEAV
jgi:hypothetical protein